MKKRLSENHPIREYFAEALHESLHNEIGLKDSEDVQDYLSRMLLEFLHQDMLFQIRDAGGRRIESVAEMIVEGDVRLNADSFDREREVHKHIGDFLLFWSGLFPEFLKNLKSMSSKDALIDCLQQGRHSYYVVSTFEHEPYTEEAPVFRKLSEDFEVYQRGLSLIRGTFEGFSEPGLSA